MIICYQYKSYWFKFGNIWGSRTETTEYVFYKPDKLHKGELVLNGMIPEEPICGWKIKQPK